MNTDELIAQLQAPVTFPDPVSAEAGAMLAGLEAQRAHSARELVELTERLADLCELSSTLFRIIEELHKARGDIPAESWAHIGRALEETRPLLGGAS